VCLWYNDLLRYVASNISQPGVRLVYVSNVWLVG